MSRRRPPKPTSALDARQRKLQEQQEKLQRETERLNHLIAQAPRIAAERQKKQRDEMIKRSAQSSRRPDASVLIDKRFDAHVGVMPQRTRRKALKAERRQERLIFFGLVFILALLILWLWTTWHWQWHG